MPEQCETCRRQLPRTRYVRGGVKYCSAECRDVADDVTEDSTPELSPVSPEESAALRALMAQADGAIPWPLPKRTDGAVVADGIAALIERGWRGA